MAVVNQDSAHWPRQHTSKGTFQLYVLGAALGHHVSLCGVRSPGDATLLLDLR